MGLELASNLWKRYSLVVIVPSFFFYCIYADYSRTQRWKASLALKNQEVQ